MVKNLSPREFDKETRQPQLTLVASNMSGQAPEDAPDTIGSALRRARLARGAMSLEEIAEEIRIRPTLLKALEEDNFAELPGGIYAAGFLRTYADYLGLDPAPLVERLKNSGAAPAKEPPLHFPEPINDPRIPRRPLVALAVVLCIAVYGAWVALSGSDTTLNNVPAPGRDITDLATPAPSVREETPAPAPAAEETPETTVAVAAPPAPAPLAPVMQAPVVAGEGQIVLYAVADAWVRVTNADQRIIAERVLKPGDTLVVPGGSGYRLLAGNAGGVMIETGGRRYGPLGNSGEVKRNFALDPANVTTGLPLAP